MKKLLAIICLSLLLQFFLFAQDKIDTVKYLWYMDIPQGLGYTNVTVSEGSFLEGEHMTLDPQTLPQMASTWQPVYDALVGSELGLEIGAIDSTILLNIVLDSLDSFESHYLPIISQVVFLYIEIDVVYKGKWYTQYDHFYFNNGKAAFMNIPISNNFLSFCNSVGINVNEGVSFAFVAKDLLTNLDEWDKVGLSWIKNESTINLRLEHFSRFGGGGKTLATGVEKFIGNAKEFDLTQNYPNPFNPTTNITYSLPADGFVSLKIYNTIGAEVATLISEFKKTGTYRFMFDASNLNSGVYFYTLRYNNYTQSRKMILIK
jgi:hypothetical protein